MRKIKAMLVGVLLVSGSSYSVQADSFGTGANQFDLEFVTIGNPGNPPDTTGKPSSAGAVDDVYRIGTYEVSRDIYSKANAEGNLDISSYGLAYITGGLRPEMPAGDTNWNEVARFVNWLNTSEGLPAAYKFTTQPGDTGYLANAAILDWQPGDPGYDPSNPRRNSLAQYFLPTENEWYKAAFYDPAANEGAGDYWDYPTGSNTEPTPVASGTAPGTAVYLQPKEQGPADVTQAGGRSPYGAMGMAGNIVEYTESSPPFVELTSWRIERGGGYHGSALILSSSNSLLNRADNEGSKNYATGFRVASRALEAVPGDFNGDGQLDVADVDDLTAQTSQMTNPPKYDLTNDGLVNSADVTHWAHELYGTWLGDSDLDGRFDSSDLVDVLATGEYEDGVALNSVWSEGDWNGDGDFSSTDLIAALADGGYEGGPRQGVASVVPEPSSLLGLAVAGLVIVGVGRRRC